MNSTTVQDAPSQIRLDLACVWIARLRSDALSAADHQAFATWLAESESNRRAFAQMSELWGDLGALAHLPIDELYPESQPSTVYSAPSEVPGARPAVIDLDSAATTSTAATMPSASGWNLAQWLMGGSLVAACLMVSLWMGSQWLEQGPAKQQIYTTRVGETRTVALPDGSQVHLNTHSELRIAFSREERRTQLLRGEAYFDVARQTSRPFTVVAGSANIRVLGTQFNIEHNRDNVRVSVTGGTVAVSEARSASGLEPESVKLTKNQKVSITGRGISEVTKTTKEEATDWTHGQLVFDQTPLTEALQELNRYLNVPAALAPNVSEKTLSGTFELSDPNSTLSAIAAALNLALDNSDPNLTLLSLKPY